MAEFQIEVEPPGYTSNGVPHFGGVYLDDPSVDGCVGASCSCIHGDSWEIAYGSRKDCVEAIDILIGDLQVARAKVLGWEDGYGKV